MVGGDILKYGSKCLIEIEKYKTLRKATVIKHRFICHYVFQFNLICIPLLADLNCLKPKTPSENNRLFVKCSQNYTIRGWRMCGEAIKKHCFASTCVVHERLSRCSRSTTAICRTCSSACTKKGVCRWHSSRLFNPYSNPMRT